MRTSDGYRLLIIDWQSTPYHANFNDAFIAVTELDDCEFASFNKVLTDARAPNSILWTEKGRFSRLARVLHYCFKNRKSKIVFISYDAFFIPLVTLLCGEVIVYEHNTTPEPGKDLKHALWQRLTFKHVVRMAQYRQQFERLKELNQRCFYIGSPIKMELNQIDGTERSMVLIGSRNFSYLEAEMISRKLGNPRLLIREMTKLDDMLAMRMDDFQFECYEWLPESKIQSSVKAIYVNVDTLVRGSGWFNDAIRLNIPLLLYSTNAIELFTQNFENHGYYDLNSGERAETSLERFHLGSSDHLAGILTHNNAIRSRFSHILDNCL